jgi:drug/metabolite transporter (DMT)-like permease
LSKPALGTALFLGKRDAMAKTGAAAGTGTQEAGGNARGILLLVLAVAGFACMDASAKWLNQREHSLQTVAVRYLGSFILTVIFLNPRTRPGILRSSRPVLQAARGLCMFGASFFVFTALSTLPITVVTSINFAAPLLVAVLAGPVLGETLGPRRVVAVIVGFIGVLVITRPGTAGFQPGMWLALGAAGCSATYFLLTRLLSRHDKPETTHFYTGLIGMLVGMPLALPVWQTPANPQTWFAMAVLGVGGALAHWLLILAHKQAPASVLSPFFYAQLPFAAVIGAVVFGNVPDRWTLLGGGIVIASGLYLLYRERLRHRIPSVDVAA